MARPTGPVVVARSARRCPSSRSRWGWWPPAGARPRGRRRPRTPSRWPRRTPPPGTPTTSRPCWRSSPPTPWCASGRGDVPPAVWDTRDPQVVRAYLDGAADGATYDTRRLRLGDRPPADRGLGGGALRAAPPRRGGPVPRRRGHGGLAVPGVRRPLPARCRALARWRATRRRWCAAAGSRGSPSSCRPRPCEQQRRRSGSGRRRARSDPPRLPARGRAEPPLSGPPRRRR